MSKFKIGDKVKGNKEADRYAVTNSNFVGYVINVYDDGDIRVSETMNKEDSGYCVSEECFDFVEQNIEIGDTVKINNGITLEDLTKNHWNGCQIGTMEFLKKASFDDFKETYTVVEKLDNTAIKVKGFDSFINSTVFTIIKKSVKEMTMEEISEALGYDVTIIKGDK